MYKRFIKYYAPHRRLFFFTMAAAVLSSLCTIFIPPLARNILNTHVAKAAEVSASERDLAGMVTVLAGMFFLIILTSIFSFIRVKWGHILGVRMEFDMRADFFRHIQKLSFNYFDNTKTGHIMSRISNDLNTIAEVAHHAPEDILISLTLIVGAFIFMFQFNTVLATIAIVPILPIAAWGFFYGGSMRKGFRNVRKKIADINSSVENSVQGIREVKSYANEDEEIHKFAIVNGDFRAAKEHMYGVLAMFFAMMNFLTEGYFFTVIAGGVYLIYTDSGLTPVDLIAFLFYIHFILNPIRRLVNFAEQFQQGTACFERFVEVMEIEPDIVDAKDAYTMDTVHGEIKITDLTFKYNSSSDWILQDVNLTVPAHKTIAIVGESGAGKSTIASLIPRFYETQKGTITIDGHDIMNLKQKFLRENIGIVQQNVFLFDSTLRDNIMYGNPSASEEQLIEASQKANIHDFIQTLPDGFDTLVGERGVKLSGGQKQRVSIARVFLKNPPIFIFDEATSSLDTESEALIQKSLDLLSQGRTTIVIAHRLSTVKNADFLFVLRQGKIVEQGTHAQLLEQKQYYHKLYSMNMF